MLLLYLVVVSNTRCWPSGFCIAPSKSTNDVPQDDSESPCIGFLCCFLFVSLKALDMIADIHEQEGRFPEAYAAKQRVVNLDPTNFRAGRDLARLGSTLMKKGEVPGYVTLN